MFCFLVKIPSVSEVDSSAKLSVRTLMFVENCASLKDPAVIKLSTGYFHTALLEQKSFY